MMTSIIWLLQGSILGSLLFLIYMDDIAENNSINIKRFEGDKLPFSVLTNTS